MTYIGAWFNGLTLVILGKLVKSGGPDMVLSRSWDVYQCKDPQTFFHCFLSESHFAEFGMMFGGKIPYVSVLATRKDRIRQGGSLY